MADTRSRLHPSVLVGVIAVLASLVVALLAEAHLPRFDALADMLRGCGAALALVIAVLLYSRARAETDPEAAGIGNLFLFAAGGILPHSLDFAPREPLAGTVICAPQIVWHVLFLGLIAVQEGWVVPPWRIRTQLAGTLGLILLATPLTLWLDAMLRQAALPLWLPWVPLALVFLLTALNLMILRSGGGRAPRLWLLIMLVVWLDMFGLRALGGRRDSLGAVGGGAILLGVELAVFGSVLRGLMDRLVSIRASNARLERLAHHDALTGLPNRRRFDQSLYREWRRCAREAAPLAVVLMDVDMFKQFNDLYGHPMGDACLARLGALLRGQVDRPGDLAARFGGEEFALLLPGEEAEGAWRLAEQLRLALRGLAIRHEGSAIGVVTLSAGVACIRPYGSERGASELVKAADKALYVAKQSGRDRVAESTSAGMMLS